MMRHKILSSIFIVYGFAPTLIHAEGEKTTVMGGTVHFVGEFVEGACSVSTLSDNQVVYMGQYKTSELTQSGKATTGVPFNIVLEDCNPEISSLASVSFYGQADATDPNLLAVKIRGPHETAVTAMGIEIRDKNANVLTPDGKTYSTQQTLRSGANNLAFVANYKSVGKRVPTGQASAEATFFIHYE